MIAWPFSGIRKPARRSALPRRAWVGGFNLMPYRQRDARRARRRLLLECVGAAAVGCAAVLAWAGWDALERARVDARRDALEATLASLGAPLAESRRLERMRADERSRAALAHKLSAPGARVSDLVDGLSREPYPGVVLRELRQTNRDVTLVAQAGDSLTAAAWLARLGEIRGVRAVEAIDLQRASAPHGKAAPGGADAVELSARLRWEGEPVEAAQRRNEFHGGAR
jgi:Tfp pilus assembly protein PilN